jgi:hypothetical protein
MPAVGQILEGFGPYRADYKIAGRVRKKMLIFAFDGKL